MLNNYEILLLFVTVAAVKGVFLGDRSHCIASLSDPKGTTR